MGYLTFHKLNLSLEIHRAGNNPTYDILVYLISQEKRDVFPYTLLKTTANTGEWGEDIAHLLIHDLTDAGRFRAVTQSHQADYAVLCARCGQWKPIKSIVFADLQGKPYKAYRCFECQFKGIAAHQITGYFLDGTPYFTISNRMEKWITALYTGEINHGWYRLLE